jgi:hypothetical protein
LGLLLFWYSVVHRAAGNSTEIAQAIAVCNPPKKEDRDAFLRDLAGIFDSMLIVSYVPFADELC